MLYFSLYQLRQTKENERKETEDNSVKPEERSRNIDDLTDLSSRCENLLEQCFRVSCMLLPPCHDLFIFPLHHHLHIISHLADFHLLQELLHIDVLSLDGCQDLISILLEGYLETNVDGVASVGLYKSSSVYVRLFGMLFDGDEELRRYLLHPESGCGDVLKEVGYA